MSNKIASFNISFISLLLVLTLCQFSYAEEFFVVNKENLSHTEQIIETQTYIDLVWVNYVYRKPAYGYTKDPASIPIPYVPAPVKKTIAKAKTPATAKLTPVPVEIKAEVKTESAPKIEEKSENKAEPKIEEIKKVPVTSIVKPEISESKESPKSETKVETKVEAKTVNSAEELRKALSKPLVSPKDAIDAASRPPYESFVSEVGEDKSM